MSLPNREGSSTSQAPASLRYPPFRRYDRRLIAVGLVLLILGGIALYNTNALHTFQSTFNILAGKFFKITSNLRDQTIITGSFRETGDRAIKFYIMNSVQFASYQLAQGNNSLFSLSNVSTGSITYTATIPDTYYLVFAHGSGLLAVTETVNFQRTYISLDEFQLGTGILLLILGPLVLYWGLRPRQRLPEIVASPSGTVTK